MDELDIMFNIIPAGYDVFNKMSYNLPVANGNLCLRPLRYRKLYFKPKGDKITVAN